ncbi:MAG: replicative DNA helicase [Lachnospiraceae bacterium]|nr:replicative DNA helicase [Lachnospiraceae bacterium]
MDQEAQVRKMPESHKAEKSVIACMMMDREAAQKASDILTKEDFQYQNLGLLFEVLCELYDENKPTGDPLLIQEKLRSKNASMESGDESFLGSLLDEVSSSLQIEHYANIVKDKSVLRKTIKTLYNAENECYSENEPVDNILERAEQDLFKLAEGRGGADYESIHDISLRTFNSIIAASKNDGNVTGIASGFGDLDRKTAGFQNSDYILVAARPSMGKTAFVLNIALNILAHSDKWVAIFSLEMSKEQLTKRLYSMHSRVDSQKIRTGKLTGQEWSELVRTEAFISDSHLIIDDTPGITMQELRKKCRKYKVEHGLDIIMIDYLQLMTGSGKSDSRQQEVSDISRQLKALARELNVPVIVLSQLSRKVEERPDHKPMMSDLRESGAIEQDADVVMFIYREDYYKKDTENKGISEIIIAKQRQGPIGSINLLWVPDQTLFKNLENHQKNDEY